MATDNASLWLVPVVAAQVVIVWRRLLAYLRYFQQEAYDRSRFLAWAGTRSLTDPAFWLSVATAWSWERGIISTAAASLLFTVVVLVLAVGQPDPRRSGKISLKMTWRATRVVFTAAVLALGLWTVWLTIDRVDLRGTLTAGALVLAGLPLWLVGADAALSPYERSVQRGFEADAIRILKRVHPTVIGITGSYGKSSTKAMLAHILQFNAPTLAATGSINTLMGITRHIREQLVPGHRFLVVEMGAYGIGSIRRLCRLTPPAAAIITAVGDMHLERFGSLDTIVAAKRELAEALPAGGLLVVNADSPGALKIAKTAPNRRVLLYGASSTEDLETRLEQVRFTNEGTLFVLETRGRRYACFAPIHGRPIVLNLAGAFTLAVALGLDPELVVASFATLKPVSNRLEVVVDRGITWIRDAYNANQFGFRAALELVASLPADRRILVTPGVIELGSGQAEVNRGLSRDAAEVCDRTIVVSETNRDAFVAGHRDLHREDRLVPVVARADAFRWLEDHSRPGDAVVLENDLPDLYERADGVFWKVGTTHL
jgi:UDP-N-acetylmuramoyl-tripeptide--D-alanyl-D-alanine ligase